jgi:hypothetical protein
MKALAAAVFVLASLAAGAQGLPHREGALRWICAGIGTEERRTLAEMAPRTPLEVLFVTARRGGYLAGAELSVYAERGAQPLLRVTADGPICLIDAPPGAYRIEAGYAGAVRKARITITKAGGPPRKLVFAFPEEPWDGIRASPEEKRQAAQP